ncbi:MAG: hypothetical protein EOM41_08605 [Bacilli bacterium]|nr:hypothetical protein [Bacilli bacterium]
MAAGIVLLLQLVVLWLEPVWLSGLFFVVYTLFQIFSIICRFGADIYILREYHSLTESEVKIKYNQAYLVSFFLSMPFALLLLMVLFFYIYNWSQFFLVDVISIYSVVSIGLLLPFFSSSNIVYYIYQAKHKVNTQVIGLNLMQPFLFLSFYLVIKSIYVFIFNEESTIPIAFAFHLSVIMYFSISILLAKKIGMSVQISYKNLRDSIISLKIRYQFIFASAGTQIIGWMPYLLSSYILGPGFASLFNVIQRFAMVTSFFSIALNSVAAPKMAEWSKAGQWMLVNETFWNNTKKLTVIAIVYTTLCWLGLLVSGKATGEYLVGSAIILFAYAINCSTSICGYYFQVASKINTLNITLYSLIVSLPILTYYLALNLKVIGASLSILIAVASVNVVLFPLAASELARKNKSV